MQSIRRVAVIGAGSAGRQFAVRCLAAGMQVVLEDVLPSRLRLAEEQLAGQAEATGEFLRLATTVDDAVRDADLAIDFMPDDLESKLEIFSMLDRMAPPRTIFCTPLQRLSLTDLASCTYRGELCVALQGKMMSDEITLIHGGLTAPATVASVSGWLGRLGYAVHLQQDREEPMLVKNVSLQIP